MKKIAVITTGGTIGSVFNAESVSVDSDVNQIADAINVAQKKLGCLVAVTAPINKNSENLNPKDWGLILSAIDEACVSDADAVVVTHGTDTMAFTVAAVLAFSSRWQKKICFTGSFYPPEHAASDASLNLLAALEFSIGLKPATGVFVAFRSGSANDEAVILNAAAIKPMNFDSLYFETAYANNSDIAVPCLDVVKLPDQQAISLATQKVVYIKLYPGIDQQFIRAAANGREVLVLELYHSGTGPAGVDSELLNFLKDRPAGLQVFMATFPQPYIELPYASTVALKHSGAKVYADLQTHFIYVFSLLAIAAGLSGSQLVAKLQAFEQ